MGGIFVPTAATLVLLVLASYGTGFWESLVLLVSWPILFFSSVMLTEPLTLPPKKWQQGGEAAVVAVLFAVPIQLGDFTTSFVFALLVGNLIAFGFSRRQSVALHYQSSRQLTPSSHELTFTSTRNLSFEPGQYMELTVPHKGADMRGVRRTFSITSEPGSKEVTFGIKFYEPSSTFKTALRSLSVGTIVRSTGISGGFTLPRDASQPLLFIAGGIGITPFISFLRHLSKQDQNRDIILFYAVSTVDELAYIDVLRSANIQIYVVTSDSQRVPTKNGEIVRGSRITEDMLHEKVADIQRRLVYISGPPLMIDGTKDSLKRLKVKRSHIKTDYFIGY
jgi:ferredoxin-NADP reductase